MPESDVNAAASIKLEKFPQHFLGASTVKRGQRQAYGSMGTVFMGKYGAIPVALKAVTDSLDTLLDEADTVMKLRHPNLVRAYGIWKDNSNQQLFLVFINVV